MDSLLPGYYNNLFGIEITTLGIIAAATFVFLQMLHTHFSYRDMLLSLKRPSLVLYVALSVCVTLTTGLGSLHFAIGAHDLVPFINFESKTLFESDIIAALVLLTFLVSASFGIASVFGSIRLLNPYSLMRKHLEAADSFSIQRFLHKRYGVPSPLPIPISIRFLKDEGEEDDADKTERERKEHEAEAEYAAATASHERLKKDSESAVDVFEGFESLVIKAVANGDISTCKRAIKDWSTKLTETLEAADAQFPTRHLATYAAETLVAFLEACKKHGNKTLPQEFVSATQEVALCFMQLKHQHDAIEILKVWKEQADIAISESNRLLFREIIRSFQEVADVAFAQEKDEPKERHDVLDESFRNLGWLAERLLTKKGLEEKPVMWDSSYHDEFDAIYNALFHFEHKYNFENPKGYPLIFFDAIRVLFDRLLEIYMSPTEVARRAQNGDGDIKNWLWSCAFVYASFASDAMNVSNGDGVALAALRLKEMYRSAEEAGAEDVARSILELIVRFAIQAAANHEKLKGGSFLGKPVQQELEEVILGSSYRGTIRSAVSDNFIRVGESGDYKVKGAYIKSLGVKLGTNFGLMFDETTGADYAQNDPRRR